MPCKMLHPEGLVIALVFITTIVLIDSQIPENLVIVDVRPVFLRGYDGMLKCQFNGAPRAVFWLKGPDLATGTNLVTWYPPPRGISGSGYESGTYNLTEDFSLVINDVDEDDAGRYICRISNFRGFILRNFTNATVQIPPQRPFPTIDTCSRSSSEPCILTLETGVDSSDLTCRTKGASSGLVSLVWTHGGVAVPHQAPQESPNADGVTWDVKATITATPRDGPYVCVARLSATTSIEANASIIVYPTPVVTTPAEVFMTTNATSSPPDSGGIQGAVIAGIAVPVIFTIVVLIVVIICLKKKREGYRPLKRYLLLDKGKISDYELEKLAEILDIGSLSLLVSKLMGESSIGSKETSRDDLHQRLCQWKMENSGDARLLYSAMEKCPLEKDFNKTEAFLASEKDMVSYQDLEHICWHVQSCGETVKPILRSLRFPFKNTDKVAKNSQILIPPSRCDEILEDLQMMKSWQVQSVEEACLVEDEDCDVTVTYCTKSEKASIKDGHTKPLPSNQMIRLCRALEKAGEKTGNNEGGVYLQLSKTFYKIQDKYKSELTDEDLKKLALGITRRHCKRLGESLRLHDRDIDAKNEEDLRVMFRTDIMLKAWMLDQRCSNYEIRRRLRRAAEQCNRHDIADLFIGKDQSEVMSSEGKLPASLTLTNETQSQKAIAAENKKVDKDTPSQSVRRDGLKDVEETQPTDNVAECEVSYGKVDNATPSISMPRDGLKDEGETQPTDNVAESEVSSVAAISRDELDRIGRYAGQATLLAFCKKYNVREIPEQQSPEGKELPFETKIINRLKPKLDSEHDKIKQGKWKDTPRNTLRKLLEDKKSPYVCLLPKRKEDNIFDVELIELAFRLIMADVYPFAKALGINDQLLTHYKPNFGPNNLGQGTVRIIRTDVRIEMVKMLKQAGYLEEAKAIYFGFEIGLGDVVEVENRADMAQLAQQLCVPGDIQGTSQDTQSNSTEGQRSALLRWKDTVRSSTFNQRLTLADALFKMGEEQLALDVISGKYRNRVINNPQSELLAKTIPEDQLFELSQVLGQKDRGDQNCQDIITAWASDEKFFKFLEKKPITLSNQLLAAGFYDFAQEIMAGAWRGKEDKKAAQKETEDKRDVTSKEPPHVDSTGKEQGAEQDKEHNEIMEKDTEGNTHPQNTGKEGAGDVKKNEADSTSVAKDAKTVVTVENHGGKTKEKGGSQEKNNTNNVAVGVTGEDNASATKENVEHEKQQKKATDMTEEGGNIDETVTKDENDVDLTDWVNLSGEGELQDVKEEGAVPTEMNTTETAHSINEQGGRPEESNKSGQDRQSETPLTDDSDFHHWSHSQAEALARLH